MAVAGYSFLGDHECAVFTSDDHQAKTKSFENCKTNHEKFMTIDEFRRRCLSLYTHKRTLEFVWRHINKTVMIKVSYTSTQRPDYYPRTEIPYPMNDIRGMPFVRNGTGSLDPWKTSIFLDKQFAQMRPCPCLQCKSQNQKSMPTYSEYFVITTATHVLFDTSEAERAVVEFFYDSEDRKRVKCIYGLFVLEDQMTRLKTDLCRVVCVTHDMQLANRLKRLGRRLIFVVKFQMPSRFLVSHPHGMCKKISFGKIICAKRFLGPSMTFNRGLKIRVSGNPDSLDMTINMLNLNPEDNICGDICGCARTDRDGGHKTFALPPDVTVSSSFGFSLAMDTETGDDDIFWWHHLTDKHWWTLLPGTTISSGGWPHFTHQTPDGTEGGNIKIEIECNLNINLNERSSDAERRMYLKYTMASCPGSSGALVHHSFVGAMDLDRCIVAHFGLDGDNGRSGLVDVMDQCKALNWFNT